MKMRQLEDPVSTVQKEQILNEVKELEHLCSIGLRMDGDISHVVNDGLFQILLGKVKDKCPFISSGVASFRKWSRQVTPSRGVRGGMPPRENFEIWNLGKGIFRDLRAAESHLKKFNRDFERIIFRKPNDVFPFEIKNLD